MLAILLSLFRFLRLLVSGHQAIALENLALRRQLAAYRRKRKRPVLTRLDRLFGIGVSQVWQGWRDPWSSFSPTPSSAGNENDFDDSGPDSLGQRAVNGEGQLLPMKFAA
jgi:hypothetical protein